MSAVLHAWNAFGADGLNCHYSDSLQLLAHAIRRHRLRQQSTPPFRPLPILCRNEFQMADKLPAGSAGHGTPARPPAHL